MEAGRRLNLQFVTLQKLAKGCGLELYELLNFNSEPGLVGEHPPEKLPDSPARRRRKR